MKKDNSRRKFIKQASIISIAGAGLRFGGLNAFADGLTGGSETYSLPPLPYAVSALEPHIDKQTMEIHHGRHHQGYVNNLNKAVAEMKLSNISLDNLLRDASKYGSAIRNNGGGHYNHSLFWKLLSPAGGGEPTGSLAEAINKSFGSFAAMKEKFTLAANSRFGSGWAWLVLQNDKLEVGSTPNQDNPLMDVSELKGKPLLALDVWEHAYYLKYQNKRNDYVNAFWNLVNWKEVSKIL